MDIIENEKDTLKKEKSKIDSEAGVLKNAKQSNKIWFSVWVIVVIATIIERICFSLNASTWQSIISISGLVIAIFGLILQSANFDKNQKQQFELQYKKNIIDDEVFLNEIKEMDLEERALRQLTKKQADLDRYHVLNLFHTKLIFIIGVLIIIVGICVIIGTLITAFISRNSVDNILLIAGFAGGILINFIGAVFIAMYTKTVDTANKYQAGLVEATNAYLGNVLASQIDEQQLREQTLSIMAKELVSCKQETNNRKKNLKQNNP